ncbi:hypothetical protein [Chitinophaga caseinilytica]|uniref:hypothetical protein n=1 Tax=Chitinophaga caseinilytica TaxID=2267521 RepID=UPI003C2C8AC9
MFGGLLRFFMPASPYVRYQVFPVVIAAVTAALFVFLLGNPDALAGNLVALGLWCCVYAYFKLSAPARFRNDRVIWWTILTAAALLILGAPFVFGLLYSTPVNIHTFWVPAMVLLFLEYLWPFPPERQARNDVPEAEAEQRKSRRSE